MPRARGAVITGGGTGIGKATAIELARRGFEVLIAGRRQQLLEQARAEIELTAAPGAFTHIRIADVGAPEDCEGLIREAVEKLVRVDVLVNAAGIFEAMHALSIDAESWDRTMDVNLRGSALCSITAARHMREQGGGRIVLIASINGAISEPDSAHYSASKAAISSLARSLAVDLAKDGIVANAVAPGWVATPMVADYVQGASQEALRRLNPQARVADPSEIATVVAFLASEAPQFLTGATIFVDGGETAVAPVP